MTQDELTASVRAAQGGSLPNFEILVYEFQDMAVGYSRVLLNDFHLAEDAAQDAFVQAFTRLGQLQTPAAFPGWFRQIVFSCCNRYRRRRTKNTVQIDSVAFIVDPNPLPDMALAKKEWSTMLNTALTSLSEQEKTVLSLHYIREHSTREIAAFLEVSPTTVKNRIHSAQKKLRGRLLTMTRQHLTHEAPSQDKAFAQKVLTQVEATCQEGGGCLAGSLHAVLGAGGIDGSLAKVNSLLGYSFHFCLFEDAARTEHHSVIEWALYSDVLHRLGFEIQRFEAKQGKKYIEKRQPHYKPPTAEELNKLKADTWNAVCASIDRGIPAIAWSPMTKKQREDGTGAFEWGLLVGYDKSQHTYTVHHRWRSNKPFSVPFDDFGYIDPAQWYHVMVFGKHTPPDPRATVQAALEDAITFADGTRYDKDTCCYPVAAVGLDAYELWLDALTREVAAPQAVRGNINELKFNRQMASAFLRESADLFETSIAQTLSQAAACYDMEIAILTEVRNTARTAHETGGFSPEQNREAISGISAAFDAEKLAVGHVKTALEML